ncbi:hypothetical protein HanIR_Chr02g0065181 [Helianthus annuus]|nr:hypothetical protein HanIR_Chr02g0065181 [Helianthus annuus]
MPQIVCFLADLSLKKVRETSSPHRHVPMSSPHRHKPLLGSSSTPPPPHPATTSPATTSTSTSTSVAHLHSATTSHPCSATKSKPQIHKLKPPNRNHQIE